MTADSTDVQRAGELPYFYPEHERLALVKPKCDAITDFLNWAAESGIYLCVLGSNGRASQQYGEESYARLLGEHFDISQHSLELEKSAMLGALRAMNEPKTAYPKATELRGTFGTPSVFHCRHCGVEIDTPAADAPNFWVHVGEGVPTCGTSL